MLSVEKDIGERLRQARESIGLSLDQLQARTKIQKSFIVAIENGEFNKLPSPFYVRTYLRAYCKCVKIEPHHILRQYRKAEQAERGLTSVHQAITPEMLAQAQQQQGFQNNSSHMQNRGHMAGTGLQNSFSQTVRRTPTNRNSRINMNTALTIAKTKPNIHNQADTTGKLLNESIRPSRSSVEQTRKANFDYTQNLSSQNTRLTPSLEHTQIKGREQTRKKRNDSVIREELQKKKERSINPNLQTASQSYQNLSRTANQKSEHETTHPPILERKRVKPDLSEQKATKMPKLSRSSVRSKRRSSRHGSFRWPNKKALIIIASLVICIPLLWATVAALATNEDKESNNNNLMKDKPETKEQTPVTTPDPQNETPTETSSEEQIVLTNSSSQLNTYEVSGTDKLDLQFRAQGESWVQVRKQPNPQKDGYLDEATLQSGHEDGYSHNFSDGKEIWISLGIPDSVIVTVNGKQIKSSKTIHIKQK